MGMSSVVYATLRCLRCGDAYRTHVQFKTGDDWGPFCEEGEPATHHEPGCYEGTADGYCPACMRGWVLDEKSSHLGALALERTIDVDVEVTDDRAVHVRRGTTAPYEREPRWTRGVSPVDGVAISYLRTGGDKAPLVLLHGLMGSGACWSPVARALEGEFDVIMPDARGHGASGAPAQGYSYDELQAEVVGLIGRLGLARLVIVGHSMGGMTAAVMASYLHGLVRAVILVDPTFLTPERQREVEASDVAEQHRLALQMTQEQLVARAQKRSPHRSLELHEHLAEARLRTHLAAFEVLRPPYPDHLELVREIRAPALLVLGDDEPVVTRELAEELQRVGVGSGLRVVQIADAGHGLPYDQPARLAEEIAAFVRQLP